MRWQQFANTLAIFVVAAGFVAVAAFFFVNSGTWFPRKPKRPPAEVVVEPAPSAPVAPMQTPIEVAPPVSASTPVAVEPKPLPTPQEHPSAPKRRTSEGEPLPPPVVLAPAPEPKIAAEVAPAEPAADTRPGASAAKHMLTSIKCYREFAYEGQFGGRQRFSALCVGGNRRQVSCLGAGCKIEYAPAPSHLP
jgi:hypothetical protein